MADDQNESPDEATEPDEKKEGENLHLLEEEDEESVEFVPGSEDEEKLSIKTETEEPKIEETEDAASEVHEKEVQSDAEFAKSDGRSETSHSGISGFADDELSEDKLELPGNEYLIKQLEAITNRFQDATSETDESQLSDEFISALTETFTHSHAEPYKRFLSKPSIIIPRAPRPSAAVYGMDHADSGIDGELESIEGDPEMIVLDPDHPLMQRFQNLYKEHLEKQKEKVTLEYNAYENDLKKLTRRFEDKDEALYNTQQELAKLQAQLETLHSERHGLSEQRVGLQEQMLVSRQKHKLNTESHQKITQRALDLREELSRWDLVVYFMNKFNQELKTDVGAVRCAAESAGSQLLKIQDDKQTQDRLIKKKLEEVIYLQDTLELYKSHCTSQDDELVKARLTVAESLMQIECIEMEKKHIFQQWNNVLRQLQQKDELIQTLQEALKQLLSDIIAQDTRMSLLRKENDKEMELNEILTMARERTQRIHGNTTRDLINLNRKLETVQKQFNEKTRVMRETENVVTITKKEVTAKIEEERQAQKKLESIAKQRSDLEGLIMDKMMEFNLKQKSTSYSQKQMQKLQEENSNLELLLINTENDYSTVVMKYTNTLVRCDKLREMLCFANRDVEEVSDMAKSIEKLITRNNLTISKKQILINNLSGRLEDSLKVFGVSDEISPLENHIRYLDKTIDEKFSELQDMKANWLRQQTELVNTTQEKDCTYEECVQMNRRYYVMQNKKRRLDEKIANEEKDIHQTEMNIKKQQVVILRNNEKLGREKGAFDVLAGDTIILENNVIHQLKEAELDTLQMQEKLNSVKNETHRLEQVLLDEQQNVMVWEKKIELAKEAKALVASEEISGEIQTMRWEIHRMQVRYSQLCRQQELLVQESEKLVSKRESIFSRNEIQQKTHKKCFTKTGIQKVIEDLRKKLKESQQMSHSIEDEIGMLTSEVARMTEENKNMTLVVQNKKSQADSLENSIRLTERQFQKNFHQLVALQLACKYLQSVREGKYKRAIKNDGLVVEELKKTTKIAKSLHDAMTRTVENISEYKDDLKDLIARHTGRVESL